MCLTGAVPAPCYYIADGPAEAVPAPCYYISRVVKIAANIPNPFHMNRVQVCFSLYLSPKIFVTNFTFAPL